MKKHLRVLALLALALATTGVNATNVNWNSALPLSINAGVESPLVLFGFNPQPEPPPAALLSRAIYDPTAATQELSGIEPTPFQVYLAAQGGDFGAHPPDPGAPFDQIRIPFTTTGGSALTFLLSFGPSAVTIPGSELFFNPQPEPPPLFATALGLQFQYRDLTGIDTIAVKMQVFDDAGNALGISPVPLPAAVWLFGSALLGLVGLSRRKKQA